MCDDKMNDSEKLEDTDVNQDEVLVRLHPILPRGYSRAERARLRKFEKELYEKSNVKLEWDI